MPGDFIEDSDLNAEPPQPERKHHTLFKLSDMAQNRGLTALRDSLVSVLPLAVVSTILYIAIAVFDFIGRSELIQSITSLSASGDNSAFKPDEFLKLAYVNPFLVFCALIPVFFSVAFTYELSIKYRSGDALPLSLVSGAATFIALYSPLFVQTDIKAQIMEFPSNLMSGNPEYLTGGVFIAVVVTLLNYLLYRFFVKKGITSPLPVNVTEALQGGFRVVLPGLVTTLLIIAVVILVGKPFGYATHTGASWLTHGMSSIYALVLIVILVQIIAFFGIQGASSIYSIFWVVLLSGSVDPPLWGEGANYDDFATLSTIFFFVMIGGTGSTLSLNLAMLRARSEQVRKLGNMTLIPSLMNSNDLIIFGLPLAFNRHLLIPFFLVPLLNVGITYTAFASGLITAPSLFLPPYLPAPLGAFLACGGNWYAVLICVVNILIGAAIYSYFLIPYDFKVNESEEIPDDVSYIKRYPI